MKRNILTCLLTTLAAATLLSSCAKVNYEDRVRLLGAPAPLGFKLGSTDKCIMTEGEQNKPCVIDFISPFTTATTFAWTIVNRQDAQIDLHSRFKTLSGTATSTIGQNSLTLLISAVDIDNLRQGTQEFMIMLAPQGTDESLSAGLTLLDANKMPVLSFVENVVQTDDHQEARLSLQLDETSTVPVKVMVNLVDGSAKHYTDYNGFKGNRDEIKLSVTFPPNTKTMPLPVIGVRKDAHCPTEFFAKMSKPQQATIANDTATIQINCALPPPPPPPPVIELDGQKFIMSEGEARTFDLTFIEMFKQNMNFTWRLESKDANVKVPDRFKIFSGRATALVDSKTLTIGVTAVDIDNLRQGTQEFMIVLTPEGTNINLTADLTLLDKVKMPNARYDRKIIRIGQGQKGKAKIILDEPSTLPIIVEIETEDGTAKAEVDYTPIKTRLVVPPGVTFVDVPVEILPQAECKERSEFYLNVINIENAEMLERRATIVIPRDEDLCQPPPPPPPSTPAPPPPSTPAPPPVTTPEPPKPPVTQPEPPKPPPPPKTLRDKV